METNINAIINNDILVTMEKKNNTWDNIILEKFLINFKDFKQGGNSYTTYRTHILKVYNHYKEKKSFCSETTMLKSIDIDSIEDFFQDLKEKYACSTFNLIRSANYEFFEYLKNNRHLISSNPMDIVKGYSMNKVKENKKEKETLTIEEMRKILLALDTREKGERNFSFNSAKNKFLLSLLLTTGLRINEALSIKLDWIEQKENGDLFINIPRDIVKNKINKRVPITKGIIRYYLDYMEERELIKEKIVDKENLIISANGRILNTTDVNAALKRITKKAGLEKEISAHCFRHSLTRILISNGVEENIIYHILGWSLKGIISSYGGGADDPTYDSIKMEVCNIL